MFTFCLLNLRESSYDGGTTSKLALALAAIVPALISSTVAFSFSCTPINRTLQTANPSFSPTKTIRACWHPKLVANFTEQHKNITLLEDLLYE